MAYDLRSDSFGATPIRHACMYPLNGFGLVLFSDPQYGVHMYHLESLEMRLFLDYTARLAGLYMACCAGVSPQIPECEWWRFYEDNIPSWAN